MSLIAIACAGACAERDNSDFATATQDLYRANDFYVTAHMTNTIGAVKWALGEGANALEMDLRFHDDGAPDEFRHGGVCDCSCNGPANDEGHVCRALRAGVINSCEASAKALDMMAELVRQSGRLALVLIDSKVDGGMPLSQQTASGTRVIDMLNDSLFAPGYRGKVVVSAANAQAYGYLLAAARRATTSPYRDRIFFALDQMGKSREDAANSLSILTQMPTRNRAFGTGITSCAFGNYEPAISQGDLNEDNNSSALTYLWTIDSESSMRSYLERTRPRAIITNRPALLKTVALSRGLQLATPDSLHTEVSNDNIVGPVKRDCRCDYHKGGCSIAEPAPPGQACKCRYVFLWTCRGDLTSCTSPGSEKCSQPDSSKESCDQGGGDCGGYR